jgi:hypothetical protein
MGHERRTGKAVEVGTRLEDIESFSVWSCDFCGKEFSEPITLIHGELLLVLPSDHRSIPTSAYVGPECLHLVMPFLDDTSSAFLTRIMDLHGLKIRDEIIND